MYYLKSTGLDTGYYLALEEHLLTKHPNESFVLIWSGDKAIVTGRYQNVAGELSAALSGRSDVRILRRISGGGTVYHDEGNVNYAFITEHNGNRNSCGTGFAPAVAQALKKLGADARCTSKQDIFINGVKVSGCAQRIDKARILHHGTLLFNSDLSELNSLLCARNEAYKTLGTSSSPSPVGNIGSFIKQKLSIEEFGEYMLNELSDSGASCLKLTGDEEEEIVQLKKSKYDAWEWTYGNSPYFSYSGTMKNGRGQIGFHVRNGRIESAQLELTDASYDEEELLCHILKGNRFTRECLRRVFTEFGAAWLTAAVDCEGIWKSIPSETEGAPRSGWSDISECQWL